MATNEMVKIQPLVSLGCRARITYMASLLRKSQGEIVEEAFNEWSDKHSDELTETKEQ